MSKLQNLPAMLTAIVKGTVTYSHIVNLYTPEEVERRNAANQKYANANGHKFYPKTRPYGEITLNSPVISGNSDAALSDALTEDKFYSDKNGELSLNIVNYFAPPVYLYVNGETTTIEDPTDISAGSEVCLVLQTYTANGNTGVGVQSIICLDEYKPYGNNAGLTAKASEMLNAFMYTQK